MSRFYKIIYFLAIANLALCQNNHAFIESKSIKLIENNNYELKIDFVISNQSLHTFNNYYDVFYALNPNENIKVEVMDFKFSEILNYKYLNSFNSNSDSTIINEYFNSSKQIDYNSLSNKITPTIKYCFIRNIYTACISIPKYYNLNNSLNQIKSVIFSIKHNFSEHNSQYKPTSKNIKSDFINNDLYKNIFVNFSDNILLNQTIYNDSTGKWFDRYFQYLKFTTYKDGIYRINFNDLKSFAPQLLNSNPKYLHLFNKGIEIPIKVFGESDNNFNDSDYIEFPSEKNYTNSHFSETSGSNEYQEYLNRYSDSSVYFLSIQNTFGLRQNNIFYNNPIETLKTYTEIIHQEKNNDIQFCGDFVTQSNYKWTSGDLFFWGWLNANGQANSNYFDVSDISETSDSIQISAKFSSWGASNNNFPAHNLAIKLNNLPIYDSVLLNKFEHKVLKSKISISNIQNGNNTIKLLSRPTSSTILNAVIYDWFELAYPRKIKVKNDSLIIRFDNLKTAGIRVIQITGLTTNQISIYKIKKDIKEISNISFTGQSPNIIATFIDSVQENDVYFVQKTSNYLTPNFTGVKVFNNYRNNLSQTDYLIVTNSKFILESTKYADQINKLINLKTKVIDVEDIYDEYNFGYFDPEAIRSFLKSTANWIAPMPSYLFLIGDASYDYKFHLKKYNAINYVPSLGYPVSDQAFAIFNDSLPIPQLNVGRLPANKVEDLSKYFENVKSYLEDKNSDWNKRYLFFSGGKPEVLGETNLYKSINENIISSYINPSPISGVSNHFYKTINPQSDFGPYSTTQIKDAISNGAVLISYIGHSGTQTWDNSIGSPQQLKNDKNKFSLITDFGCSTGKWAEPQIKSFSEIFVSGDEANALWYIGNSFLGFESNAILLPPEFVKTLVKDSNFAIGKAHKISKLNLLQQSGFNDQVRLAMMYTNTLIGDPAIEIAIPKLVNLHIDDTKIYSDLLSSNEESDSTKILIPINNFGKSINDSCQIEITHQFNSSTISKKLFKIKIPFFTDTLIYFINSKNLAGTHQLTVKLDPLNLISELREDDNIANQSIFISSSKLISLSPSQFQTSNGKELIFLRPSTLNFIPIEIELDTLQNFNSKSVYKIVNSGNLFKVNLIPNLILNKRYFWRILNQSDSTKSIFGSFKTLNSISSNYLFSDSIDFLNYKSSNLFYKNGIKLSNENLNFRLISSGGFDGSFGVLELNGVNVLPNTFSLGYTVTVFDTINFKIQKQKVFNLWVENPNWKIERDSLISFINSVPYGQIVCAQIIDEGTYNLNAEARNAFRTIGSALIDSVVNFRDSWGIIGRKGATIGSMPEMYKKVYSGKVVIETTFVKQNFSGRFETPIIGPATNWNNIQTDNVIPRDSKLKIKTIGISQNGIVDTLKIDSLSLISSSDSYPFRKYLFDFIANSDGQSPILSKWSVESSFAPELVLFPNSISISKSISTQGEENQIQIKSWNYGFANAESVKINILLNDSSNFRVINTINIPLFNKNDSLTYNYNFNTNKLRGNYTFKIYIDPNNLIPELVENNNQAEINFQVLGDTVKPIFQFFVDGEKLQSNDFVRKTPDISILFQDNSNSIFYLKDTSNFELLLNFKTINKSDLNFNFSNSNSLGEIKWKPTFDEGENFIQFIMRDLAGNISDTLNLKLKVSNKNNISELFPIPSPFKDQTYFSFKILGEQNPISGLINIYTINGKLINTINILNPKIGFQKVFWDGKDFENDEIGNGIYLYKLKINFINDEISEIGKIAKLK